MDGLQTFIIATASRAVVLNYQTMALTTHAIQERELLLPLHMEGRHVVYCLHCTNITHAFASTFRIASTRLPRPPVQLLNLQECAEVIYPKWPLLFLILTWFQKSQIIGTILNINLMHLLCCVLSPCDSVYVTSLTGSGTPCRLHRTLRDARDQCHPRLLTKGNGTGYWMRTGKETAASRPSCQPEQEVDWK